MGDVRVDGCRTPGRIRTDTGTDFKSEASGQLGYGGIVKAISTILLYSFYHCA